MLQTWLLLVDFASQSISFQTHLLSLTNELPFLSVQLGTCAQRPPEYLSV